MDKKLLSESDICDKFIRPAMVKAGWGSMVLIDQTMVNGFQPFKDAMAKLMRDGMSGVAITRVTLSKLADAKFPLPPIAEQSRIVARVEELRQLCSDLRQCLAASRTTQSHLTEALVESV